MNHKTIIIFSVAFVLFLSFWIYRNGRRNVGDLVLPPPVSKDEIHLDDLAEIERLAEEAGFKKMLDEVDKERSEIKAYQHVVATETPAEGKSD